MASVRCSKLVSSSEGVDKPVHVSGCILATGHAGQCQSVYTADRATMVAALKERSRLVVDEFKRLPVFEQVRFAADLLERGDEANAVKALNYVLFTITGEVRFGDANG
ncbi:MAG TPA: hypothetical protein VG734_26200 [Lacunisphaera sp.]|nr:hypothetical protein [Lacunisphaera sp.]